MRVELARSLDEKIMQPVRTLLGDATQLLVSPDGAPNLIPFEALLMNMISTSFSVTPSPISPAAATCAHAGREREWRAATGSCQSLLW